ncbi:Carbon-nitrogen hydrolase [Spirosomataceae bacterium TFI 002]|nr:Carbon-nitrogen hydrolase [Spirosomataceae bacterium TFI 002]
MSTLKLTIIQPDTIWENPGANRALLEEMIHDLEDYGELILLPEMFTTGFTTKVKSLAEPMNFTTHKWLRQIAAHTKAHIGGSFIVKDGDSFFNRFLLVAPDGSSQQYDKKHLFRMSEEKDVFTSGNDRVVMDVNGWKVCPLICYDLRFPIWARNTELAYDLLIYSACWPAPRDFVWNTLLAARALENQSYVAGINRVGEDGKGISYLGNSQVVSPKGEQLIEKNTIQGISQVTIHKKDLQDFRAKFPVHLDADSFKLNH